MTEFITRRKPAWDRLNAIVLRAGPSARGVRHLSRDDLKSLGSLYRRAGADLAYARLRGADPTLIAYLNDLVLRAHGLIYSERKPGVRRLWNFLALGFPRLLYQRRVYILLAAALFLLGGVIAAFMTAQDPEVGRIFLGKRADETEFYRNLPRTLRDQDRPYFAATLMQNNIRVGILAFAVGILGGFPTLLILFNNGLPIGALAVLQHQAGYDTVLWSFLLPHGIPELTAIFVAGAAGMLIGHALIAPGELSRQDALTVAGRDAVRLLLGTVALFVLAGFIESFISPSALPAAFKFAFAALIATAMAAYFRLGVPSGNPSPPPQNPSPPPR